MGDLVTRASEISVALLKGGTSGERPVSLASAEQVARALISEGYRVEEIDTGEPGFSCKLESGAFDVAFICLHGRNGEDGTVQGLCELLNLPYTGSGVLSSALAMDKHMSKIMYQHAGIPTPPFVTCNKGEPWSPERLVAELGEHVVVKPAREGSALGVTIVHGVDGLGAALETAFAIDDTVVVERFVSGVETTVGILGKRDLTALPVIEIVPENDFYDFESKYAAGMSTHVIPARIPAEALAQCQQIALDAHNVLGCRGVSRSDLIVEPEGSCWLLETNTIPGMTPTSLLPDAAQAVGIDFSRLCSMIVEYALEGR